MTSSILGLHHVTATVSGAQEDLEFYAGLLGFRLVKKTVNFDNRHVYHFYYGDATGTPGTIMTTFPYRGMGVPPGRKGAGQITAIGFSVPGGSLDRWRERLAAHRIEVRAEGTRLGEDFLTVSDPSGLIIDLVATPRDPRVPWVHRIDEGLAPRGIGSLELTIADSDRTIEFLNSLLGFTVEAQAGDRTRLGVAAGGPGRRLDIVSAPRAAQAVNGLGTVHHLALAVATPEVQLGYREEVLRRGISVTPVRDRQYFQSIYFREPGGVLLEIATVGPGFLVDESLDELGLGLKLPPWEEPHRDSIAAGLPEVIPPGGA
jgi:glyoxalase family protein